MDALLSELQEHVERVRGGRDRVQALLDAVMAIGPADLRSRAEELGGTFGITRPDPTGTLLERTVPLPSGDATTLPG